MTNFYLFSLLDLHTVHVHEFIRCVFVMIGVDKGLDISRDLLVAIYHRVKETEFQPNPDHTSRVMKLETLLAGHTPVFQCRIIQTYCRRKVDFILYVQRSYKKFCFFC